MKIKDVINEGVFDDLRALGQQAQRDQALAAKSGIGRRVGALKGALTPKFYQDFADKVSTARRGRDLETLADAWVAEWDKYFRAMEKTTGPISDDAYRNNFRAWLSKTAKVNVNPAELDARVPVQSLEAVKKYLTDYFIPAYQKIQSNPVYVIPDGTTVDVISRVGSTNSTEVYTWQSQKGHWYDSSGNEIAAFSNLHNALVQDAMDKASNTRGGGGAATV
jgi:hypothetical protein